MHRVLGVYEGQIFALFRIVTGILFASHGAQKLFGVLGGMSGQGDAAPLASLMGLAGIIEFFGGLLVALGLLGSYAAFVASGHMAVAYFMVHQPRAFWPLQNDGELAALYAFAFLYIAARGSGPWSVASATGRPDLG